jgi:hypothetical protein
MQPWASGAGHSEWRLCLKCGRCHDTRQPCPEAPAPAVVPDFVCPVCQTSTPRDRPDSGYCANCRGSPWQCWNSWCQAYNRPRTFRCHACGCDESFYGSKGEWGSSSSSKRRR